MIKIYCNGNIHMSHRRIMPLHHNGKVLIKWEFCRVDWRQRLARWREIEHGLQRQGLTELAIDQLPTKGKG